MNITTTDKPDLIAARDVCIKLGVTRPTLHKWLKRFPDFPRPIKLSGNAVRYRVSEIDAWIESRRETAPAAA